jgi:pyridoxal phosphate enzyme (YggS family)
VSETIAARLASLRAAIDAETIACGREAGSVALLGVSKKQPVVAIVEAAQAGVHAIGENYVQEAKAKFAHLPQIEKHFIGHIQTNKAKAIVELFDVVQTVDRPDAARALANAARAAGRVLPVLLQLNISPAERYGCPPDEAFELAGIIRTDAALRFDGVMAIGPISEDRQEIQAAFALAAKTFAALGGSTLSIGMSGDWREAVRAGSTMVRIGTALFGERR